MGLKALSEAEVDKIIFLRKRGYSLPEIKQIVGRGYGTIFRYIRGVEILPQFQELWREKRKSSSFRKLKEEKNARLQAEKLIKKIGKKEKILIAVALYWAEGAKRDFSLTNTDPALINTFVNCLNELGVGKERISINLRIFEDLDREEACKFWAKVVGIPKEKISYIDVLKGKKKGKLKHGMCRLRVIKGGGVLKLFNAIGDIIKKDISAPVV